MFITRQRRFYNNVRKGSEIICNTIMISVFVIGFMLALTMC